MATTRAKRCAPPSCAGVTRTSLGCVDPTSSSPVRRRPMTQTIDIHTHYLASTLVAALERRTDLPRISEGTQGRQIEYGKGNIHPVLPNMGDVGLRLREMDEQ